MTDNQRLKIINKAILIRNVEQKLLELFSQGKLFGTVHTCIGAVSVVKGIIPDNCVAIGNPTRVISSLDDYLRMNSEIFEQGIVVEKMCSQMNREELNILREKFGEGQGFEL